MGVIVPGHRSGERIGQRKIRATHLGLPRARDHLPCAEVRAKCVIRAALEGTAHWAEMLWRNLITVRFADGDRLLVCGAAHR